MARPEHPTPSPEPRVWLTGPDGAVRAGPGGTGVPIHQALGWRRDAVDRFLSGLGTAGAAAGVIAARVPGGDGVLWIERACDAAAAVEHEQFQVLIDAVPCTLSWVDADLRYLRVNRAMAELFGEPPDAFAGRHVGFHGHGRDLAALLEGLFAGDADQTTGEISVDVAGEERFYELRACRYANGRAATVIGVDVTEHKLAQEALWHTTEALEVSNANATRMLEDLREARDRAEAASRAKDRFLASMSHEIRTPMNGIIGMAEILLDTPLSGEQQEFVRTILSSAEALHTLLSDILDLSKAEAGKIVLDPVPFRPRDTLADTLSTFAPVAHRKGLDLTGYVAPSVPEWLVLDPGRLRQVLSNLVGNAVKFTEAGEVTVHLEAVPGGDGLELRGFVADTGIGVAPEHQDRIFRAFEQEAGATARLYGGTGLGLAISARLVALMGGRLTLESPWRTDRACPGGPGSRFDFSLRAGAAEQPDAPADRSGPALAGLRALVVCDSVAQGRTLTDLLEGWGVDARWERRADRAVDRLVRGGPVDLVLVDARLGDGDGFEFAARARDALDDRVPPVILLAGAGQRGDAARCRELGIVGYLTKPVLRSETLEAAVRAALAAEPGKEVITRHSLRERRPPDRRLRILVAEDNPVNRKVITRHLEDAGHEVVLAENGAEAVARFEPGAFDGVFMDIQMPVMDGFEAVAEIRRREDAAGCRVPVVALTAHAVGGYGDRCRDAGMDGYLTKPVRRDVLLQVLDGWATGAGAAPRGEAGPETAEADGGPPFDLDGSLALLDGDRAFLAELAGAFLDDLPRLLGAVEAAVSAADPDGVRRTAHALKGAVRVFAAPGPAALAEALENAGRDGDADGIARLWPRLRDAAAELRAALEAVAGR